MNRRSYLAPRRLLLLFASAALAAQTGPPRAVFLPFAEAEPVVVAAGARRGGLPAELQGKTPAQLKQSWPDWVRQQDAAVRARLAQGDEDSLVNFLLFGASFTRQPRLTQQFFQEVEALRQSDAAKAEAKAGAALGGRVNDLIAALASPRHSERLDFMRRLLAAKGLRVATPAGQQQVRVYLLRGLKRVSEEYDSHAEALRRAREAENIEEELAVRSRLFATRGVSLDTSLLANLAIENTLRSLQEQGLLAKGSASRLAVIGPGLDFVDKSEGYDFYPLQTIQPFALMDSAIRLGLADRRKVQVTSLDISRRVNEHLARMRQRARNRQSYVVQLPQPEDVGWEAASLEYWKVFGDRIGAPAKPVAVPPGAGRLKVRAVRIPPEMLLRVHAQDVNAVYQRLELPESQQYDLIIATNIFVYYGPFEQSLALVNAARMLRPGGFLLSNNQLPETPSSGMEALPYVTTVYSDRTADGDHIFIYRRTPASGQR